MPRAAKGSDFEREICRELSKWWTHGERDDVFWRTSQSGGRATERAKKGKTTFGSYGDIAAVDPIGAPLMKFFTIELKRGSSYGSPGDLLDFKHVNGSHPWIRCLMQAIKSHQQAGSKAWMMICKRDHRLPIVYMESRILKYLRGGEPIAFPTTLMRMSLTVRNKMFEKVDEQVTFTGLHLVLFLASIKPEQIISTVES